MKRINNWLDKDISYPEAPFATNREKVLFIFGIWIPYLVSIAYITYIVFKK